MLSGLAAALAALSLTVTTQNVRVGLPADQVRHDVGLASRHSTIVLTQEMRGRHARFYAPAGWGAAQLGRGMRGDCATYWKRSAWELRRAWLVPLTRATFLRGHRWALVTVLRGAQATVVTVCLHMAPRALDRRPSYRHGMAQLAALVDRLRRHWRYVLVGGDWNRAWGADHSQRLVGFPAVALPRHGMRSWAPPRATGPKGGRPDYFYWRSPAIRATSLHVIGHTFSDHQGARIHLRLAR
jgi:endonuclease/exonuclease/phosphatase family metal-dependent hydrolase